MANPDSRGEVLLELIPKGSRLVADVTARPARDFDAILARVPDQQRPRVLESLVRSPQPPVRTPTATCCGWAATRGVEMTLTTRPV